MSSEYMLSCLGVKNRGGSDQLLKQLNRPWLIDATVSVHNTLYRSYHALSS